MNNLQPFSKEEEAAAIQVAKSDLIDFSILVHDGYTPNWHHEEIARKLEAVERGEIRRLMLFLPPRHGKSQLATIHFPAWYLGRNPKGEIITASYSADLAQDFGLKTRDIVGGEEYSYIFDTRLRRDVKAQAKWMTEQGGSYTSVGVGGAITGKGANILLIDDPVKNREEAESEVTREKIVSWYKSTAFTRLEKGGAVVLIMTRWHMGDLAGQILEQAKETGDEWEVVEFPAVATKEEPCRKVGEPLWKGKYDNDALDEIKRQLGPYEWSALYQQQPIASEKQEFKLDWFQPRAKEELRAFNTRRFLTVDTAISKAAQADYTGFCDNTVDEQGFWNFKAWRMRLNPKELIDLLFTLHEQSPYEKIGIEKTVYMDAIKPFLDEEMRKRDKYLPIVELRHSQVAKEIRIRGLIPRYSSRNIFHLQGECRDLEEELLNFPVSVHDDVMDAAAYQLQIADAANKRARQAHQYRPKFVSR